MSWGDRPVPNPKPSIGWDEAANRITHQSVPWHDDDPDSTTVITVGFLRNNQSGAIGGYSPEMKANAEKMLALVEDICNVDFQIISDGPDGNIAWGNHTANIWFEANNFAPAGDAAAITVRIDGPNGVHSGVTVLPNGNGDWNNLGVDTLNFQTIMHEFLHALGLGHPGNYNAGVDQDYDLDGDLDPLTYENAAEYIEDTVQYTVMSYFDQGITGANFGGAGASTPMLHDIAALQKLYGARADTRTGTSVYGFNSNTGRESLSLSSSADKMVAVIYDRGGYDTLDFSGYAQDQVINLRQEAFSSVGGLTKNVSIAQDTVIEGARGGSGRDVITGNERDNILQGGDGDDALSGLSGSDVLRGGTGFDRLTGGHGGDDLRGGTGDDALLGGAGSDRLLGDAGDDTLTGGTGRDTLIGGLGNDTLIIGQESASGEIYSGGDGFDVLQVTGTVDLRGSTVTSIEGINFGPPGAAARTNTVSFNASQFGGTGLAAALSVNGSMTPPSMLADTDIVAIWMNGTASFTAQAFEFSQWQSGIDHLLIIGNSSLANFIRGSDGTDLIFGGNLNDFLRGGLGTDQSFGGLGNDEFIFQGIEASAGDLIAGDGGTLDVIRGSENADFTGVTITGIEVLAIDGSIASIDNTNFMTFEGHQFGNGGISSTAQVWGWNSSVHDVLVVSMGFGEASTFDASGFTFSFWQVSAGIGNGDELRIFGRSGLFDNSISRDTITGSSTDDVIYAGSGSDNVNGGAGDDFLFGQDHNDTLNGGDGNDRIEGGFGNDTLIGGAGLLDILVGGGGSDAFRLDNASKTSPDVIEDFTNGSDRIELDDVAFGLLVGNLAGSAFELGANATQASTRILYDGGLLYYDMDGNGGTARILIAQLTGNPTGIDASDFRVI